MRFQAWISAHLFYHDDLTPLLTGCVRPLVEELRREGLIDKYFFIRYWLGGPHVRLRLLPALTTTERQIKRRVEERVQAFFNAYPSTNQIDERAYDRLTEQLSRLEYQEDRRVPLYANNSLHYIPYVPEYEHYGGWEVMPEVETHFMESSELALELLGRGISRNQRTAHGTSVFLLTLALGGTGCEYLAGECEKHLNAWRHVLSEAAEQVAAQFERQYQQQRENLQRLVGSLLHMVRQHTIEQSELPAARWFVCARKLYQHLAGLEAAHALQISSRFSQISAPMQILRRCVHMHSNRLGISVLEEAYMLFLLQQLTREMSASRQAIGR